MVIYCIFKKKKNGSFIRSSKYSWQFSEINRNILNQAINAPQSRLLRGSDIVDILTSLKKQDPVTIGECDHGTLRSHVFCGKYSPTDYPPNNYSPTGIFQFLMGGRKCYRLEQQEVLQHFLSVSNVFNNCSDVFKHGFTFICI